MHFIVIYCLDKNPTCTIMQMSYIPALELIMLKFCLLFFTSSIMYFIRNLYMLSLNYRFPMEAKPHMSAETCQKLRYITRNIIVFFTSLYWVFIYLFSNYDYNIYFNYLYFKKRWSYFYPVRRKWPGKGW